MLVHERIEEIEFHWLKDGYLDRQFYGECQIVTAINAWIYLSKSTFSNVVEHYERFVDESFARNGAAIRIEKVYEQLGLRVKSEHADFREWVYSGRKLPADFRINHPRFGLHSVSCVGYIPECDACRVMNFQCETTVDGWIFGERLEPWVVDKPMYAAKENHVSVFSYDPNKDRILTPLPRTEEERS